MTECVTDDDIPSSAFTATENPRFGICRGVWHEVGTIFHDGQTLVVGQLRTYICQCRIDKKIELGCLITSNRRGRPIGGMQLLPHLANSGTGDQDLHAARPYCATWPRRARNSTPECSCPSLMGKPHTAREKAASPPLGTSSFGPRCHSVRLSSASCAGDGND